MQRRHYLSLSIRSRLLLCRPGQSWNQLSQQCSNTFGIERLGNLLFSRWIHNCCHDKRHRSFHNHITKYCRPINNYCHNQKSFLTSLIYTSLRFPVKHNSTRKGFQQPQHRSKSRHRDWCWYPCCPRHCSPRSLPASPPQNTKERRCQFVAPRIPGHDSWCRVTGGTSSS